MNDSRGAAKRSFSTSTGSQLVAGLRGGLQLRGGSRERAVWQRLTAMLVSAMLFVAAFAPLNQGWCAPLSIALFIWALHGASTRATVLLGVVHASLAFGTLVHWVSAVAVVAWPALVAVMVVWRVILALLIRKCLEQRFTVATVTASWVLIEWVQSHLPWGGFPWGRIAYIGGLGWLTRSASWFSATGLTAIVVACGVSIWLTTQRVRGGARAVALTLGLMVGAASSASLIAPDVISRNAFDVGLIQGGVPREGFTTEAQERAVFRNHLSQTQTLLRLQPNLDLIVWPENSLGDAVVGDSELMNELRSVIRAAKVPILTGTVLLDSNNPAQLRNRSMLWSADGRVTQSYDKQHLVPFGEFVPLRTLARKLTSQVDLIGRDFVPGNRPGLITVQPGVSLGVLMCFEVGYEDLARSLANASFIVNQTNNATYMGSAQPAQQFQMSQVRAAETGRMVLVAATSGVSGVINGYGQVVRGTRVNGNVAAARAVKVPLVQGRTPAMAVGPFITYASLAVVGSMFTPWRPKARQRRGVGTW